MASIELSLLLTAAPWARPARPLHGMQAPRIGRHCGAELLRFAAPRRPGRERTSDVRAAVLSPGFCPSVPPSCA